MSSRWAVLVGCSLLFAVGCAAPAGKTAAEIQREAQNSTPPKEDLAQLGRELGVEVFPSTPAFEGGVATVSKDGVTIDAYRHTTHSVTEVANFYKGHLIEATDSTAGGAVLVEGLNNQGHRVRISANRAKGAQGGTLFAITVTKSAEDQKPTDSP